MIREILDQAWALIEAKDGRNALTVLEAITELKRKEVHPGLDSLHDVLVLVLQAAPIGTFISATLGVGSLLLGSVIVRPSVFETWSAWWLGDMISLLLFTPLLLTWSACPQVRASRKRLMELSCLSMFVLGIGLFVFLGQPHPDQKEYPITYLVFPPLTWAALRFGPRGATTVLAVLSSLAIVGTILDISPFSIGSSLSERLLFLQSFMGITAVATLILAAVMAERRVLERRKDAFISMASHELRTPLTSLKVSTTVSNRL